MAKRRFHDCETAFRRQFLAAGTAALVTLNAAAPARALSDEEVLRPATDFSAAEQFELMQAGALTSRKRVNADSFSHPSANMSFEKELDFKIGNGLFKRVWVTAPSSTDTTDGLGPLFNARSCQRCHLKDGRGHPRLTDTPSEKAISMFLRLSIPPQNADDIKAIEDGRLALIPEPTYGVQLQNFSVPSIRPEGRMQVRYEEIPVELAGGETASLRKPSYAVAELAYGPLHKDVILSPRVAPPMIGVGLLEAIREEDILARADPADKDSDGISGKANFIPSPSLGKPALGRFGWKAGKANIVDQSAGAFLGDIGISTPVHPHGWGDCTDKQTDCRTAPTGDSPQHDNVEVSQKMLDLVVFYSRNLAVPQRRDVSAPDVLKGKEIFYKSGCTSCHHPKYITPRNIAGMKEQSRQLIWPYTDLLLHDMGDGLADGQSEGRATGREWRTPPLWGIGLTETVSGHTYFLHDGRARNLLEAILWHGGEAQTARDRVVALPPEDRQKLIRFLESL